MISKHLSSLPSPVAYAAAWRQLRGLPAQQRVVEPGWQRSVISADLMRFKMRQALDRRINIRGGKPRANEPMDIELVRDARNLDFILKHRGRVYQFGSEICRQRFSHLLARHDD